MTGRVYLVGAGPGDPGLLTRRAGVCLERADVVVHDHLIDARVLALVPARAERIPVGQPHGSGPRLEQAVVEALLVERARAGQTVVRLKNGDPFLFGRGGEEAATLAAAGIPFEVVPGITSALAVPAYAGIPVTHRGHTSLVTIVTGHQASASDPTILPWEALARQGGTLVFLMGMRPLARICEQLVAHGLPAGTPAAVVERGTTAAQRAVVATVGSLPAEVARAGMESPAVVIVGSVVGLRDVVTWVERRPLFGRRIVVTRPRAQAVALVDRLEDAGAEVVVFPTITLGPPPDPAAFDAAVARAGTYDWIIFTSVNGVRVFCERLAALGLDVRSLGGARIAAIGPETAATLRARLLQPLIVPDDYRAEGLLTAFADQDMAGRRVLLPRAAGARTLLPEALLASGAVVDEALAYVAGPPPDADPSALRAALAEGSIDAVTFTSSSTVEHFLALVGRDAVRTSFRDGRPLVACIGPVTAAAARAGGLAVAIEPTRFTVPALADALVAHFAKP